MRHRAALIALAACGGGGGGAKVAVVAPAAPSAGARPAPELRCLAAGHVVAAFTPGGDDARAQAVASLCTRTGWAAPVVECVAGAGGADAAEACLARLEPLQHEALTSLEQTWVPDDFDTLFGSGQATGVLSADAPGGDGDGDSETTCANAIGDAARLPPAIRLADRDRTWATALRAATLATACAESSPGVARVPRARRQQRRRRRVRHRGARQARRDERRAGASGSPRARARGRRRVRAGRRAALRRRGVGRQAAGGAAAGGA